MLIQVGTFIRDCRVYQVKQMVPFQDKTDEVKFFGMSAFLILKGDKLGANFISDGNAIPRI